MKNTAKITLVFMLFMRSGFFVCAQLPQAEFLGRGNGNEVKLLWLPKTWPANLDGYNIKRKKDNGHWELLNKTLIAPSTKKSDLLNRTNDPAIINRLAIETDSLINVKNITDLTAAQMKSEYLADATGLKFVTFSLTLSYDLALVQGFAYYDRNVPAGTYVYGLFPVVDGKEAGIPLATYNWTYESIPAIQIASETEVKKIKKRSGIQVTWTVKTSEVKAKNIKGFLTYKKDSLGNITKVADLIRPNIAVEKAPIFYTDDNYDLSLKATFFIVPVDIFDSKGTPIEVNYSVNDSPALEPPVLKIKDESGKLVTLTWEFNPLNNKSIKSFDVFRRQNISEVPRLLKKMQPDVRSFSDETITASGPYFYSIIANTINGEKLTGDEVLIYKVVAIMPPVAPKGLRGEVTRDGARNFVLLNWSKDNRPGTTPDYILYTDGILSKGLARQASLPLIKQPTYKFEVFGEYGKKYRFAIAAVIDETIESSLSDTLEIFVPSKSLPQPNVWPIGQQGQVVTLDWNYPDFIDDLAGFRLYQNGTLLANESQLKANTRQWISNKLPNGRYTYEIEAVSLFGVISKRSQPRNFNIQVP